MGRLRYNKEYIEKLNNSSILLKEAKSLHELMKRYKRIHIEVGCGKGQFINSLAEVDKDVLFIGIEKYETVLWKAVKKNNNINNENLYFIAGDFEQIFDWFPKESIEKIYINFPDPWPKDRHSKRRLVNIEFFKKYYQILTQNGLIEFRTDQEFLYYYALEQLDLINKYKILENYKNLHSKKIVKSTTEYENKFISQGLNIFYLKLLKID